MKRLHDKIMTRGKRADVDGHYAAPIPTQCLDDATVVWAENSAAYFYETADKHWDLVEDFPTLAPPFKNLFIEHQAPKGGDGPKTVKLGQWEAPLFDKALREHPWMLSQAPRNSKAGYGTRWGFLLCSLDLEKEIEAPLGPELVVNPSRSLASIRRSLQGQPPAVRERRRGSLRWVVDAVSFHGSDGPAPVGPLFWWRMGLDGSGRIMDMEAISQRDYGPGPGLSAAYAGESAAFFKEPWFTATVSGILLPSLFTISLMNCKNVSLAAQSPDGRLSRQMGSSYGRGLTEYHLIELDSMKASLSSAGAGSDGLSHALHLCRGHFKSFGGDKGKLFGKHEGTYWWPQHARGSSERGTITKEYTVAASWTEPDSPSSHTIGEQPESSNGGRPDPHKRPEDGKLDTTVPSGADSSAHRASEAASTERPSTETEASARGAGRLRRVLGKLRRGGKRD